MRKPAWSERGRKARFLKIDPLAYIAANTRDSVCFAKITYSEIDPPFRVFITKRYDV